MTEEMRKTRRDGHGEEWRRKERQQGKRRNREEKGNIPAHLYGCSLMMLLSWLRKIKHSHICANFPLYSILTKINLTKF